VKKRASGRVRRTCRGLQGPWNPFEGLQRAPAGVGGPPSGGLHHRKWANCNSTKDMTPAFPSHQAPRANFDATPAEHLSVALVTEEACAATSPAVRLCQFVPGAPPASSAVVHE
jgi:hypothetical protein